METQFMEVQTATTQSGKMPGESAPAMRRKPELLMPAGNLEILKVALRYGADAVYLGGAAYGLRARADNFTPEEMREGIRLAHEKGAKVYVTANILAHEGDLAGARAYFTELEAIRPDAVLISDPGMLLLAREHCPSVPIHLSTQASTTNSLGFKFWQQQGVSRIVCARELSLPEIASIREAVPDMEIEAFVHGAMCLSYSGRCLLSQAMTGRGANQGACAHPCRWSYALVEEKRPGEYYPVEEDGRGSYILNTKDLDMIGHLPDLIAAGIDSLKVEGRMKTALYVATVARAYRRAIDDFFEDPERYRRSISWYEDEVRRCTYRGYSTGFYYGTPGPESMETERAGYQSHAVYLGEVLKIRTDETGQELLFEQYNKFSVGDTMEVMHSDGSDSRGEVISLTTEEGERVESAPHPRQRLWLRMAPDPGAHPGEILRIRTK